MGPDLGPQATKKPRRGPFDKPHFLAGLYSLHGDKHGTSAPTAEGKPLGDGRCGFLRFLCPPAVETAPSLTLRHRMTPFSSDYSCFTGTDSRDVPTDCRSPGMALAPVVAFTSARLSTAVGHLCPLPSLVAPDLNRSPCNEGAL